MLSKLYEILEFLEWVKKERERRKEIIVHFSDIDHDGIEEWISCEACARGK